MVMHARKFQRLDDGYYDRSQSHLMEDKQVNNSRGKYDRYANKKRDIPEIADFCGHSPSFQSSPRYLSKSGHGDRRSDKDRDRRGEDSRQNSRNKDQKLKDHKAEVHKLAEKVCGDWSEHVSSSGKRYYYNCKSEVSQWERPEEWVETSAVSSSSRTPRSKDASDKSSAGAGHKGPRDWSKHSIGDQNSSKATPFSSSQQPNSRITPNNSLKADGFSHDSHRTHVSSVANSYSRSRGSNTTPNSKTSSEGSATAGNDCVPHSNCRGSDTGFGDRTPKQDGGTLNASSPNQPMGVPVNAGGIYGLVASSGGVPNSNDYHQPRGQFVGEFFNTSKCDDMEISPGSTPTEESMLEKHAVKASKPVASTPVSTPLSMEQPGSLTPLSSLTPTLLSTSSANAPDNKASCSSSASLSNQTVLTTLTALQHAVSQLTVDKSAGLSSGNVQRPQTSSLLSCLALLPALINQLSSEKTANSQGRPQDRQQNQQITKQAIELLQKLQQALVAQQQQQQQRQLQQLLLQLLSVQKSGSRPATSSSSQWTTPPPPKQMKLDCSNTEDGKSESPYSPPDSDGTPLGTPDTRTHQHSTLAQLPEENHSNARLEVTKSDETSVESSRLPSPHPVNLVSAVQPMTLGTSQLAAATVLRKQDSTGLAPSLANHFNSQLIEHVTGWQADIGERQADCCTEESHTIGSIHCTQVSVELKRARSLVRANEIQATLQEQRIMFLHQRYRELEQGPSLFMPLMDT